MKRLSTLAGLLLFAVTACDTGLLDLEPQDEISEDAAIIDLPSAEAALMGAYSSLQNFGSYQDVLLPWVDLLSDDVEHTGTFGTYGQADLLQVTADNGSVQGLWEDAYQGIHRVNVLLEKLPGLETTTTEQEDMIQQFTGEALAIRALHYFALVRSFGGVPLVLEPFESLSEAAAVTRATAADVWAAIEADLAASKTALEAAGVDNGLRTRMTPGFTDALLAQAHLYQEDWAAAEAATREQAKTGTSRQRMAHEQRLFSSAGFVFCQMVFGTTPNMAPPSNLKRPVLMT